MGMISLVENKEYMLSDAFICKVCRSTALLPKLSILSISTYIGE